MFKCCLNMERHVDNSCSIHNDVFDCPDSIIFYELKFDEFGIIIHDSGKSYIKIEYCPWCGRKLPDSKRDLWFKQLEKIGITDPFEENIPEKFNSDLWWNK